MAASPRPLSHFIPCDGSLSHGGPGCTMSTPADAPPVTSSSSSSGSVSSTGVTDMLSSLSDMISPCIVFVSVFHVGNVNRFREAVRISSGNLRSMRGHGIRTFGLELDLRIRSAGAETGPCLPYTRKSGTARNGALYHVRRHRNALWSPPVSTRF